MDARGWERVPLSIRKHVIEKRTSIIAWLHINSKGSKKEDVDFYLEFKSQKFVDKEKKNWTLRDHAIEFTQKPTFVRPIGVNPDGTIIFPVVAKHYPVRMRLWNSSCLGEKGESIVFKLETQEQYEALYSALKGLVGIIPVESKVEFS